MNFPFLGRAREDDDVPVMVVPYIADTDDWRKQDTVKATCRKCAEQLASRLFRWEKKWPSLGTVKTWDESEKRFLGMDLALFSTFIMTHFSVRTADNREWLLDKKIAALIWAECIADDSPLQPASWTIELNRKREARV